MKQLAILFASLLFAGAAQGTQKSVTSNKLTDQELVADIQPKEFSTKADYKTAEVSAASGILATTFLLGYATLHVGTALAGKHPNPRNLALLAMPASIALFWLLPPYRYLMVLYSRFIIRVAKAAGHAVNSLTEGK